MKTPIRSVVVVVLISLLAALPLQPPPAAAPPADLWVHPRNEPFDPAKHYRADGELFYFAENDIQQGIGNIWAPTKGTLLTVELGRDVLGVAERTRGALLPVFLYDSDGDGKVDKTIKGQLQGLRAVYDSPAFAELDFSRTRWQLGVLYLAGVAGDSQLDSRYLASVDSQTARVKFVHREALKQVGAGPFPPGLVILKHREGTPFDLADFIERPARYIEDFQTLTRADDADDWTQTNGKGKLVTHFDREDLFIVRTEGGAELDVLWGDVPLTKFSEDYLRLPRNGDDCYSSLTTRLVNHDGSPTTIPHRLLYCPAKSVALFDAPDGYQIRLSALRDSEPFEQTEVGTSVRDNVRLYVHEIHPRNPSVRATGSVGGNIRAGFGAAREDLRDAYRYGVTGVHEPNLHTGQVEYYASPVTAVPRFIVGLLTLHPIRALEDLFTGVESTVRMAAHTVSAVDNTLMTAALQGTIGYAISPGAADTTGVYVGAVTQSAVKNLPFGERSIDALNPVSAWQHNRSFAPARYTRTDTQLNFDRVMTIVDLLTIGAIENHNDDSGGGGGGNGNGGGGGNGPVNGGKVCRGIPGNANGVTKNLGVDPPFGPVAKFGSFFLGHPQMNGMLPCK